MQTVDALKNLYKKIAKEESAPATDQIAELIQAIAEKWPEANTQDVKNE